MASYSGPKQSAWSRPHVQTSSYDARQQENVAAPPYNLQAAPPPPPPPAALPPPSSSAPRPHTYLINDTFLSRKPDRLDGGSDSHSSTPPFLRSGLSGTQRPPTSNAPREVPYPFLTEEKVAEEQHAWKQVQRGGHGDQYQRLAAEGEHKDCMTRLFDHLHPRACYALIRVKLLWYEFLFLGEKLIICFDPYTLLFLVNSVILMRHMSLCCICGAYGILEICLLIC